MQTFGKFQLLIHAGTLNFGSIYIELFVVLFIQSFVVETIEQKSNCALHAKSATCFFRKVHMIRYRRSIAILVTSGILTACATAGKDISSTYVSPMQYANYDCEQLRSESMRISGRVNQLTGRLDEAASNDKAIAGVGLILFWPALFALGGTKQQEAELSRLKGEYEAIESTANSKKCAA